VGKLFPISLHPFFPKINVSLLKDSCGSKHAKIQSSSLGASLSNVECSGVSVCGQMKLFFLGQTLWTHSWCKKTAW